MHGYFIALEGPEGAGKSTQARLLEQALQQAGYPVTLTREPGGTAIGEQVRSILLAVDNYAMLAEAEALLYAAARAQHVGEVLRPALAAGAIVVCDRYVDSTLAYQGGGRRLDLRALHEIQDFATGGLMPDLRILLDLPAEVGLSRRFGDADSVNRLDAADLAFHQRVRRSFLELAAKTPESWAVVDATQPAESVAAAIWSAVHPRLPQR